MPDTEPIKITLDDLGDEGAAPDPEPPAQPEAPRGKLPAAVESTGRQVAGAAKDAAASVGAKLAAGAAGATNRTAEIARDKVSEVMQEQSKAIADAVEQRVREIDWKAEAQKGTEGGLRWLSERLTELADRMKDRPDVGQTAESADDEPAEPKA